MHASRRNFLQSAGVASAGLMMMKPGLAMAGTSPGMVGSIGTNDPATYLRFANYFGRRTDMTLLAFNQTSPSALQSSIPYIVQQGAQFIGLGARIMWCVPFPGPGQLEAVAGGTYDAMYTQLFQAIVAASPNDGSPIYVRLPWEFNLNYGANAAKNKTGQFSSGWFIGAWRRLAFMARQISPRFQRIWCPNVTTMNFDPAACWPGKEVVEIVSQDYYMNSAYNNPGCFSWFLNEQRGLLWGANFAAANGKPYGLSEWGMNSDLFLADFNLAALWLKGLGSRLHHHCWWDRQDTIDCRISDGTHPGLAVAYRTQFF